MILNSELRRRARDVLKPALPIALLVSLCAELPGLLSQVAAAQTEGPMREVLARYVLADAGAVNIEGLLAELRGAISPAMIAAWGVALLAFLLTPCLNLGRLRYTLRLLRGESGEVADVLSLRGLFLKAIGLTLWILLKELLWMLPGLALSMAGVAILLIHPSEATLNVMDTMYFAGFVLMIALMIRAALHYIMADMIMADEPDTGIRAAVRRSIDMMRQRKAMLVMLMLSFLGWMLLASLIQSMLSGMLMVLGMTIGMACQLLISVYMQTSIAAFYEEYKNS